MPWFQGFLGCAVGVPQVFHKRPGLWVLGRHLCLLVKKAFESENHFPCDTGKVELAGIISGAKTPGFAWLRLTSLTLILTARTTFAWRGSPGLIRQDRSNRFRKFHLASALHLQEKHRLYCWQVTKFRS